MCDSQGTNDPSTYDRPSGCEENLWIGGTRRACGQRVGLDVWDDHTGRPHAACHRHVDEMRHRWPDAATMSAYEQAPVAR